jgi:hypothetical protein
MTDFVDGLERDLVEAARRQAQARRTAAAARRRRLPSRGLGVALAALVLAGSAAAAAVKLSAEPSKPLAGAVSDARPSAGEYAVSIVPDLRAGHAGWCGVVSRSQDGRPIGSGMGCGPARAAGASQIAAGGSFGGSASIEYAVVTAAVRAVRFGTTIVSTRRDPTLPHGWRYAVTTHGTTRADAPAIAQLDAAGRELPATTPADDRSRGGRSRLVTRARPAGRCAIGSAPGFVAGYARMALGMPRIPPRIEGRAFASCAHTVFHERGTRGGLTAAILLDAQRPTARAAALPAVPGLSGRRLGRGWIVVYGGDDSRRARLLDRLAPRL